MEKIESHSAEALDRLPEVFRDKPNIAGLLTVWCDAIQAFEDVAYQVLTERAVDTAIGVQLEALGAIVGQPRNGLDDDDYRRYIRARIRANRSTGTIDELLRIARLIVDDDDATIEFTPSYPGAGVIEIVGIPFDTGIATALSLFLRTAASAGVRIVIEWSIVAPEDTFFWDTTSWDSGLQWSGSI